MFFVPSVLSSHTLLARPEVNVLCHWHVCVFCVHIGINCNCLHGWFTNWVTDPLMFLFFKCSAPHSCATRWQSDFSLSSDSVTPDNSRSHWGNPGRQWEFWQNKWGECAKAYLSWQWLHCFTDHWQSQGKCFFLTSQFISSWCLIKSIVTHWNANLNKTWAFAADQKLDAVILKIFYSRTTVPSKVLLHS